MNKYMKLFIIWLLLLGVAYPANVKWAQTGFQFLSVTSDARAAATGEAMTAVEAGSSSLFFNPAGMARMAGVVDATFSLNTWIADIKYNALSLALNPFGGRYGVLGLSLVSVDYGSVQGTMVWGNDKGYIDTEEMNPSAFALGIGYSKALSDRFSVGGQLKSTYQYLGRSVVPNTLDGEMDLKKNIAGTWAVDFGTLYQTDLKGIAFGMTLRNYSNEIKFEQEGFQLPLTFAIGISLDVLELLTERPAGQSLLFSVDAVHPRSHPEQLKFGLNYEMWDALFVRAGYIMNNSLEDISFGIGVSQFGFKLDYAYSPFDLFGNVQRITVRFSL
jgi:hypothetical protein